MRVERPLLHRFSPPDPLAPPAHGYEQRRASRTQHQRATVEDDAVTLPPSLLLARAATTTTPLLSRPNAGALHAAATVTTQRRLPSSPILKERLASTQKRHDDSFHDRLTPSMLALCLGLSPAASQASLELGTGAISPLLLVRSFPFKRRSTRTLLAYLIGVPAYRLELPFMRCSSVSRRCFLLRDMALQA